MGIKDWFKPLNDKEKQDLIDSMDEFLYGEKLTPGLFTNGIEEGNRVIIRWEDHPTDGLIGRVVAIESISGQVEAMLALEPPFHHNDRVYAYHSVNVRYLEKISEEEEE